MKIWKQLLENYFVDHLDVRMHAAQQQIQYEVASAHRASSDIGFTVVTVESPVEGER